MKTMIRMALSGALLALTLGAGAARAELVVIVNPANAVDALSTDSTARIFLGKDKYFANGRRAVPGDQPEGSRARAEFYRKAVRKSEAQMKAYWSQLIFTGKDTPPQVIGGDAAVRRWVAGNEDAIGYIDAAAADGSVKVVGRLR